MSKLIRIENADTNSSLKVKVFVFERANQAPDTPGVHAPDVLVESHTLGHPTAMKEICVTSSRYLVIEEFLAAPETIKE